MKNTKVSTRLYVAFLAIIIVSALSSVWSLKSLYQINYDIDYIVNQDNKKLILNKNMIDSIHDIDRLIPTLILQKTKDQKEREFSLIKQSREEYDKWWNELQKVPPTEEGAAIRKKIEEALKKSRAHNTEVVQLSLSGKDQEAFDMFFAKAVPAAAAVRAAIEENIALQEKMTQVMYKDSEVAYNQAFYVLSISAILSAILGLAAAYYVSRSITQQLGGEPNECINIAKAVADGKLDTSITLRNGDTESILAQLKRMQETLVEMVTNINNGASSVSIAATQISQGNTDLSQRTEEQASALQETASSLNELTSTVENTSQNTQQASQLTSRAIEETSKGTKIIGEVVTNMRLIDESSKKIADIISTVDGIAFQTNILALNAAVEAARAGEQGRGFAVVASEVRSLASKVADAAKEIKNLIHTNVERVNEGSSLVAQAGEIMQEVVHSIKRVDDISTEIKAAAKEQSVGVSQINTAVSQMDQVTQQNAALVEEMAAAAGSLSQQANDLVAVVSKFKVSGMQRMNQAPKASHHAPTQPKESPKPKPKPNSAEDSWSEF